MNWNLEGLVVRAMYLDEIPVIGRVMLSRVALGGEVQHHIQLLEAVPENKYGIQDRESLIIDHHSVTEVSSNV